MSAAIFNQFVDPVQAQAISAGTNPGEQVYPVVVDAMREVGIDLASARPQKLTLELSSGAEMLITMGCGEQCPYIPGLRRLDWALKDPRGLPIEEVRVIRDEIRNRIQGLIASEKINQPSSVLK
jgi:protein-tyrosine-phosphatase